MDGGEGTAKSGPPASQVPSKAQKGTQDGLSPMQTLTGARGPSMGLANVFTACAPQNTDSS